MNIHEVKFSAKPIFAITAIVVLSFLLGYVIPGIIAYKEKVYFEKDLKNKFLSIQIVTFTTQRNETILYDSKIK